MWHKHVFHAHIAKANCWYEIEAQTMLANSSLIIQFPVIFLLYFVDPNFTGDLKIHSINHNAVKVECSITTWNGPKGLFIAALYIHNDKQSKDRQNETCFFEFRNLHYLTEYKIEVSVLTFQSHLTAFDFTIYKVIILC